MVAELLDRRMRRDHVGEAPRTHDQQRMTPRPDDGAAVLRETSARTRAAARASARPARDDAAARRLGVATSAPDARVDEAVEQIDDEIDQHDQHRDQQHAALHAPDSRGAGSHSTIHLPMPGQEKIVSVRMAPASSAPTCSPITVTTGISALRSACTPIDPRAPPGPWRARCGRSPRRAPPASPSASAARSTASGMVPSTIVGRIRCASAERNAPGLSGEQAVDQHEAGHRLEEIGDRDAARDRRPAERRREDDDQQQPPPEDRHRGAGEGEAHQPVVERRCRADRGDHADRQADRRSRTSWRRPTVRRSPGTASGTRSTPARWVTSEVPRSPLRDAALVVEVLLPERPIEAELWRSSACRAGRCRARRRAPRSDRRAPGGCSMKLSERDAEEGRDDQRDAAEEEAQHGGRRRRRPGRLPMRGQSGGAPRVSGYCRSTLVELVAAERAHLVAVTFLRIGMIHDRVRDQVERRLACMITCACS